MRPVRARTVSLVLVTTLALAAGATFLASRSSSLGVAAALPAPVAPKQVDYSTLLRRQTRITQNAEALVKAAPLSWIRRGELAGCYLDEARLTGDYDAYARADRTIDEAFAVGDGHTGPNLLRAQINFTLHRFDRVAGDLDIVEAMAKPPQVALLAHVAATRGGLAMQMGHYDDALRFFSDAIQKKRDATTLVHLADYHAGTGALDEAQRLYEEAARTMPADEAQGRAWLSLQRGHVELERGSYTEAMKHYAAADAALPGFWLVEEHIAEIDALEGRRDAALNRYRDLVARTDEPEFMDAMARLLLEQDPVEAARWIEKARSSYEKRLTRFPEATYGHALDHYLELEQDSLEAIELAEKNHALRPGGEAKTKLAQAYLLGGRKSEAREIIGQALAMRWRKAETHATAAIVFQATGDEKSAAEQRAAAVAMNPHAIRNLEWLDRRTRRH